MSRARAFLIVYVLLYPHPVYPACVDSPDWHLVESGAPASGCVDAPGWVKEGKPDNAGCAWVADDPDDRCHKQSKDKVTASEACECACGSLGGTAAPTAEPGASFAGADSDLRVDQTHHAGVLGESVSIVELRNRNDRTRGKKKI